MGELEGMYGSLAKQREDKKKKEKQAQEATLMSIKKQSKNKSTAEISKDYYNKRKLDKPINRGFANAVMSINDFKNRTKQTTVNVNAMQNDFFFIHRAVEPKHKKLDEMRYIPKEKKEEKPKKEKKEEYHEIGFQQRFLEQLR